MLTVVVCLFAGCAPAPSGSAAGRGESGVGISSTPRATPLTLDECGSQQTYVDLPQRAVSYDVNMTEMLLYLGLRDRMAGYAGVRSNKAVSKTLQPLLEGLPALSMRDLNMETLLGVHADIVVGGWSYGFHKGAITPALLADYGIASYVIRESCIRVKRRRQVRLTDTVRDLRNLAAIFGVADKVAPRIDALAAQIKALRRKTAHVTRRPRVFVYDGGRKTPTTAGRFATPQAMIRLAGGRNIFDDIPSSWTSGNWEDVVKRDPQWIIINDYGQPDAAGKIAFLENKPVLAEVTAIRKRHFLVMTYAHLTPGPYNVMEAQRLAAALHPELGIVPVDPVQGLSLQRGGR